MARKIYVLEGRKVVNRWVGARQMVKRVAVGTLIGAVGIVVGVVAGWALIDHYMVQSRGIEASQTPYNRQTDLKLGTVQYTPIKSVTDSEKSADEVVTDNYGLQEPADAYFIQPATVGERIQ